MMTRRKRDEHDGRIQTKHQRYTTLLKNHFDKVADNPAIDLVENTTNPESLDKALEILEKIDKEHRNEVEGFKLMVYGTLKFKIQNV